MMDEGLLQAKLVLEENQVLVSHMEVLELKMKDKEQAYVQEVAKLTRKCIQSETDKSFLESDFNQIQVNQILDAACELLLELVFV